MSRHPSPTRGDSVPPTGKRTIPSRRKHFVVTGYLVNRNRVLLLFHRKLRRWLPPGGHVEEDEDPWLALVREFREETGLRIRPVSCAPRPGREHGVRLLPNPHHLQVERIDPEHDHVDLVFLCRWAGGRLRRNQESDALRWFSLAELNVPRLCPNVRTFARQALEEGPPADLIRRQRGIGVGGGRSSRSSLRRPRTRRPR